MFSQRRLDRDRPRHRQFFCGWAVNLPALPFEPPSQVIASRSVERQDAEPFGGFIWPSSFNNSVLRFAIAWTIRERVRERCTCIIRVHRRSRQSVHIRRNFDGQGVVSLFLFTSSGLNTNILNGKLQRHLYGPQCGLLTLHTVGPRVVHDS